MHIDRRKPENFMIKDSRRVYIRVLSNRASNGTWQGEVVRI